MLHHNTLRTLLSPLIDCALPTEFVFHASHVPAELVLEHAGAADVAACSCCVVSAVSLLSGPAHLVAPDGMCQKNLADAPSRKTKYLVEMGQVLQPVCDWARHHAAVRVLLLPSTRDAMAAPVFPTPPLVQPDYVPFNVTMLPNPATFTLGEVCCRHRNHTVFLA